MMATVLQALSKLEEKLLRVRAEAQTARTWAMEQVPNRHWQKRKLSRAFYALI